MAEEVILPLFDDTNTAITGGAASTGLKIRRGADGYLFDWNDTTFKASGWTTLSTTFTEIDATNLAGYYKKSGIDISGWNDGWYQVIAAYTGSPKRNAAEDWLVKGGKIVEQRTADNLDAQVSLTATQTSVNTIDDLLDTEITAIINALTALQTDIGDPSVDATTLYAQILAVKGYVDEIESRLTATRAGYLDNLATAPAVVGDIPTAAQNATAVWAKAIETLTAEEIMRLVLAALAGKRVGLGTATEQYMAQDGTTPRITFAPTDASGNGTPVLNGAP